MAFKKVSHSLCQSSGCTKPALNGMVLNNRVMNPIPGTELNVSWVEGWKQVQQSVVRAFRGLRNLNSTHEMTVCSANAQSLELTVSLPEVTDEKMSDEEGI